MTKKIKLSLELTDYQAALLMGLITDQVGHKTARQPLVDRPGECPACRIWEQIAGIVATGIQEAREVE